jgi:hypothetical protein
MTNNNAQMKSKSDKAKELSPANSRHPFWSASTGSEIRLVLQKPPPSSINSLTISVYTISQPYVYKIVFNYNGVSQAPLYHKKKNAIKIIRNEWMKYYENRTRVEYMEHKIVPFIPESATGIIDSSSVSPRSDAEESSEITSPRTPREIPSLRQKILSPRSSPSIYPDSCPPSPSPRTLRKISLKNSFKLSRHSSPRFGLSSSEPSPRDSSSSDSPREKWYQKRLSLPMTRRNKSNSSSRDSSPRDIVSEGGLSSPRTTKLLETVSLQLQNVNKDIKNISTAELSKTPRNSINDININ